MARGVNKVILVGNLGNDPETRFTASGSGITTISVATSEAWKDKQSGEAKERTEWHRVKFFGRLAEIAGEYLKKGSQVYIEGALRTEKYTDKEGSERWSTEIIASELQMLGGREGGSRDGNARAGQPQREERGYHAQAPQRSAPRSAPPRSTPMRQPEPAIAEDDDIPF